MTAKILHFPLGDALDAYKESHKDHIYKYGSIPVRTPNGPQEFKLLELCRAYIKKNDISGIEIIYRTDRVAETAVDFVKDICEIVGYNKPEPKGAA